VSAAFEHERRKTEYHLYWYNAKKGLYNDFHRYQCLSHKLLNKREMKLFIQIVNQYNKEIDAAVARMDAGDFVSNEDALDELSKL
jgi:hypothetical protein